MSTPYRVCSPPKLRQAATVARHLQAAAGQPIELWGIGRESGVRALEGCRVAARDGALAAFDSAGTTRLWERIARLNEPQFSASQLEQVRWRLIVRPVQWFAFSGRWNGPQPAITAGFAEAIREEPHGGRTYLFGLDNWELHRRS